MKLADTLKPFYAVPARFKNWLPSFALFEREVRRFFTVPTQTLGAPLGSAVLYFTVFHLSIGRLINQSGGAAQDLSLGLNYVAFLIPGIMTMEMVNASFQNPVSSILIAKWNGNIVDQLMAPISATGMWAAYIAGAWIRTLVVAISTFIAGILFVGWLPIHNITLLLFGSLCITTLFGSIGILAGALCKTFDQVGMIGSFIIQPLMFLSGVFFSLSNLPEHLSLLPYFNPAFYFVNLIRYSVVGKADVSVSVALLFSFLSAAVIAGLALSVLKSGKGMRS